MDILSGVSGFEFAKDFIPRLFEKLINIKNKRNEELDKIANIFGDPILLAQNYVIPDCQQFNPADYEDEVAYVVKEPVFNRLEAFFDSKQKDNQLFILADAGMGKTSVLMMLKLAHINSFWPKDYDCVLLKLGHDTLHNIKTIQSHRKTILLLDALDEDPLAWGQINVRIFDLLSQTANFKKVIITCRTQFFSGGSDPFDRRGRVSVVGYVCPVIYLSLFSDRQIKDFCQKKFNDNPELIVKAALALSKMKSLKCRPMLLSHIEDILESEQKSWTVYSVYDALITSWLNREQRKIQKFRGTSPSASKLRDACMLYASKLFEYNKKTLSQQELDSIVKENKIGKELEYMDISGRSLLNKNSDGEFRFSHYTIQEFLLVKAILMGKHGLHPQNVRATDQIMEFLLAYINDLPLSERKLITLRMLDFSGVFLSGSNLSYIGIQGAVVRNVIAKNINFTNADLKYTDFTGCDLQGTDFSGANLLGTNFSNANLKNAIFSKNNLNETKFSNANFADAEIKDNIFIKCDLSEIKFSKTICSNTIFQSCNFMESALINSAINDIRFLNCDLSYSSFKGSTGRNVEFIDGSLRQANLWSVEFYDVIMKKINIAAIKIDETTIVRGDFFEIGAEKIIEKLKEYSNAKLHKDL